jgi:hypothetical protein
MEQLQRKRWAPASAWRCRVSQPESPKHEPKESLDLKGFVPFTGDYYKMEYWVLVGAAKKPVKAYPNGGSFHLYGTNRRVGLEDNLQIKLCTGDDQNCAVCSYYVEGTQYPPANFEEIMEKQEARGWADAMRGNGYGQSNEAGTMCEDWQRAYDKGWKAGREKKHDKTD